MIKKAVSPKAAMHHVRGLVRSSSLPVLKALEAFHASTTHTAADCLQRVGLIDRDGQQGEAILLHPLACLGHVESLPSDEALQSVQELRQLTDSRVAPKPVTQKTGAPLPRSPPPHCLYTKLTVTDTQEELRSRQLRFLAKLRGRVLARDPKSLANFKKELSEATRTSSSFTDEMISAYNGVVEELADHRDREASMTLASDRTLPPLSTNAASRLAKLVDLTSSEEISHALKRFAAKDNGALPYASFATHLGIRLREEGAAKDLRAQFLSQSSVDIGSIYPADPTSIQSWCSQWVTNDMLPGERAATILTKVRLERLMPRRIMLDAIATFAMQDLSRPWISDALRGWEEPNEEAGASASGPLINSPHKGLTMSYILKDPRRHLVDQYLLHDFAALLNEDAIPQWETHFAHFMEVCGECHNVDARPSHLNFTMRAPPPSHTIMEALTNLAPSCAYWRTLIRSQPQAFSARVAPNEEMHIEVNLPPVHECMDAAVNEEARYRQVPILYEDAHVMVLNKPAGLAMSDHALSGTQRASPSTDLLSLVLRHHPQGKDIQAVVNQGLVHRLDAETSGCVMLAKTDEAARSLRHQVGTSAAFSVASKVYWALCVVLEPDMAKVPLSGDIRDPSDPKIRTNYRIVRFFPRSRHALVECRLQQGKKHQIRRHLAAWGLPIVGDVTHGGSACCQVLLPRVALHAASIHFAHPISGDVVATSAPLPEDLHRALAVLSQS